MSIATIKAAIKTNLDELVSTSVLAGATQTDIKKDPLYADHPGSPWAYLMPPSVESEGLDNRTNIRKYAFDILIIVNAENLASTTELEELVEDVMDKFDNDPTLSGTALAGLSPLSSAPVPFQHGGKDLIMIVVQITAQETVTLSFP